MSNNINTTGNEENTANVADSYNHSEVLRRFDKVFYTYKKYEIAKNRKDRHAIQHEIEETGKSIYLAMEWAYKFFLHNQSNLKLPVTATYVKVDTTNFYKVFTNRKKSHLKFHELTDLFIANNNYDSKKHGDLLRIRNNNQSLNNDEKHPKFQYNKKKNLSVDLEEVMKEVTKFYDHCLNIDKKPQYFKDYEASGFKKQLDNTVDPKHFILVLPPLKALADEVKAKLTLLLQIEWTLVIDFETNKEDKESLYQLLKQDIGEDLSIPTFFPTYAPIGIKAKSNPHRPIWLFANGQEDEEEQEPFTEFDKWAYWYGVKVNDWLNIFKDSNEHSAQVLFLPDELTKEYQNSILDSLKKRWNKRQGIIGLDIYLLANNYLENSVEQYIHQLTLSSEEFLNIIKEYHTAQTKSDISYCIPDGSGKQRVVGRKLYDNLNTFSTLLYEGIANSTANDTENFSKEMQDFYDGSKSVTWQLIKNEQILERTTPLNRWVEILTDDLNKRKSMLHDYVYRPGYGGSTFLAQLAWKMHQNFPALIINRRSEGDVEQLHNLYNPNHLSEESTQKSNMPLLLFIDSNNINKDNTEKLHKEITKKGFAHTIFYLKRHNSMNQNSRSKYPQLEGLSNNEVDTVVQKMRASPLTVYSDQVESFKKGEKEKSLFLLAMYALQKDFVGIEPYVKTTIAPIPVNPPFATGKRSSEIFSYKDALCVIALGSEYSNGIPYVYFRNLNETFDYNSFVSFHNLITKEKEEIIRVKHELLTNEILRQFSNLEGKEFKISNLIAPYLIEKLIKFADRDSKAVKDFFERLFIEHEGKEGKEGKEEKFAKIIERIKEENLNLNKRGVNDYGKDLIRNIFKALIIKYPEHAHFHAHYGRFLSSIFEYIEAIKNLETAANLEKNYRIKHMLAMAYSNKIKDSLNQAKNDGIGTTPYIKFIDNIREAIEKPQSLFNEVQINQPSNIAGYTSDMSLVRSIIKFAQKQENLENDLEAFIKKHGEQWKNPTSIWFNELLEHIEKLYDEAIESIYILEEDKKQLNNQGFKEFIKDLRSGQQGLKTYYEKILESDTASAEDRARARTYLASIISEEKQFNDQALKSIENWMIENLKANPRDSRSFKRWLDARYKMLDHTDDEAIIEKMLEHLTVWIENESQKINPDLFLPSWYRYILTFIQTLDDYSPRKDLKEAWEAVDKIKGFSKNPRYSLGKGVGLARLIPNKGENKEWERGLASKLQPISGSYNQRDMHTGYISYKGHKIFIDPRKHQLTMDDNNNTLQGIAIFFSYNGARAYYEEVPTKENPAANLNAEISSSQEVHSNTLGSIMEAKTEKKERGTIIEIHNGEKVKISAKKQGKKSKQK